MTKPHIPFLFSTAQLPATELLSKSATFPTKPVEIFDRFLTPKHLLSIPLLPKKTSALFNTSL